MGYHLNCLDEPVFMAGPKPLRTEFGIHHGFESCEGKCFNRTRPQQAVGKLSIVFLSDFNANRLKYDIFCDNFCA